MLLTSNGSAAAGIGCDEEARFAAEELRRYVEAITGVRLPWNETPSGPTVHVSVDPELPAQSYRLRGRGNRLELSGRTRLEALHAVYYLLERHAGCFWAAPGQDDLPRRETLELPDLDETHTPATPLRGMQLDRYAWLSAAENDLPIIDWMAKRRMNFALLSRFEIPDAKKQAILDALRKRGMESLLGLHTFNYWLPPEKYFGTHPEYYSLREGRRLNPAVQAGAQICMTHAGAVETCAANIIRYLEDNPGIDSIGLGANDGAAGWCECPACEALEPLHFSPIQQHLYAVRVKSLTYATFCNRVVAKVVERFPRQRFAALFYTNTLAPPADPEFRLHPNIDAVLALFERLYDRPLEAGVTARDYRTMLPDKMLERRYTQYPPMLRRWREIVPGRVYFHAYFMGTNGMISLPFPFYDTIVRDLAAFRRMGLDGFYTQSGIPDFGTYGLNFYLAAEAAYDIGRSTESIVSAYCRGYYGPAAPAMTEYYLRLDAMACSRHNSNVTALLLETFDERTSGLKDLLAQAAAAARQAEPRYAKRVAQAEVTLRYALLCRAYRYGWLRAREMLQRKDMEELQRHIDRLEEMEKNLLDLAGGHMLGQGLLHYPELRAVEKSVLGNLRREACREKMTGHIDFDIPWDVTAGEDPGPIARAQARPESDKTAHRPKKTHDDQ